MFNCSFFGLWEPVWTGFCVLLILVFGSFLTYWQHQDIPDLSVCFLSQTWNQLFLRLLSKFPTDRIPGSLVGPQAQLAVVPFSGKWI